MTKRREAKLGPKGRPYGGSATRLADGGRGGATPRGSQGSALKALRLGAPEEPTPGAPVHPTLVGRTDATMFGAGGNRSQVSLEAPVEPTVQERASVHWPSYVPETMSRAQKKFLQHRFNRRCIGAYHRCNDVSVQEKIPSAPVEPVKHRCIASVQPVATVSAVRSSMATSCYE